MTERTAASNADTNATAITINGGNSLRVAELKDGRKAIIIRTSDRIAFKQCRRKWGWSSHLKRNLGATYLAGPLWFGSAIHYALEDFHGYNHFGKPSNAFKAYCIATAKQHLRELPGEAQELYKLGQQMMDYYTDHWLRYRTIDQTYWEETPNGYIPQTEVNFEIEVPIWEHPTLEAYVHAHGADCVLYRGTIYRVGVDDLGRLWVIEYKTAKRAEALHFQTDPQVTTYVWAASHVYERPVAGVIYYQFVKTAPEPPRQLSSGKISTASNLVTSYPLYKQALEDMYGAVSNAPVNNVNFLAELTRQENPDRDRYIQRERVYRNEHMCAAEAQKILMELEDMLNPNLPLYPNPTRDCSRMCSFLAPCVSMDDGSDWEQELEDEFAERDQAADRMWRSRLPSPQELHDQQEAEQEGAAPISLESLQLQSLNQASEKARRQAEIDAGETGDAGDGADSSTFSFDVTR